MKFVSNLPAEDRRLFTKLLFQSILFPVLVIVLLAAGMTGLLLNQRSLSDWVDHADRVLAEASHTERLIVDTETALRGFALTHSERFLEPWKIAQPEIAHQWQVLNTLLVDDITQTDRVELIRQKFESWQAFASEIIQQINDKKNPPDYFDHSEGKARMDSIRADFDEFILVQKRLRQARLAASSRARTTVFIVLILLSLLAAVFIGLLTRRLLIDVAKTYEKALNSAAERTRQLMHTTQQLEKSNRELEQFAAIASHDLKEPLRMVKLYVQFLQERYKGKFDERGDEYIAYTVEGVDRMRNLIDSILSYSQVSQGNLSLVPVDSSSVLERALTNLKASIEESGAIIKKERLPMILGEPVQLCQLFQNLIANAIKFRRGTPEISISVKIMGPKACFSVADNGIGIPADMQERIFGLFQRLHKRAKYPGTGIGLAICKKIVEQLGGEIWVESKPDQGATFFFTLALA